MRKLPLILSVILTLVFFISCNKEKNQPYEQLVFSSLTASDLEFQSGESVTITADATGTDLVYHWSYNSGKILGKGNSVSYSTYDLGQHKVICTVVDSQGNIKDRTIMFFVQ